jgi:hypothetical protein
MVSFVTPAQAGVTKCLEILDSGFIRNDPQYIAAKVITLFVMLSPSLVSF